MNWLLKFLGKRGRKYAFVDFYGDVQMYRYFPLFYEPHEPTGWRALLPNVFIHVYPGEPGGTGPDGESPHAHPYSSLGVVVKGAYTEVIDESETRRTCAMGATFVSYKSFHRLLLVNPGTVSLFFHGWRRRREWLIDRKRCVSLCAQCQAHGKTSCVKDKGVEPFRSDVDEGSLARGAVTWIKVDGDFEKLIRNRKRLVLRLGTAPVTNDEKMALMRDAKARIA